MLLHVLHQALLAGGLEAADAAAEQENTIFHAGTQRGGLAAVDRGGVLPLRA